MPQKSGRKGGPEKKFLFSTENPHDQRVVGIVLRDISMEAPLSLERGGGGLWVVQLVLLDGFSSSTRSLVSP